MQNKNIFCALLAILFISVPAWSLTIKATASDMKFEDMTLTQMTQIEDQGASTDLQSYSHGLRKKKVFGLVTVNVYVAEFLAAHPDKLAKTENQFVDSFSDAGPTQLKLTMVRDLKGSDISKAFTESLEANKITAANMAPELKNVLEEVKAIAEFKNKDVFSLVSIIKDGKGTLHIQKPDGSIKTFSGPALFLQQLFSIWFGTPSDPKLGDLKKTLMKI